MRSMKTRSRRGMLAVLLSLLAVLSAAFGGGSAASAAVPAHRVLTYVALGDSYAAGQAAEGCTHTSTSYPLVLDRLHRIKLLRDATCAGARIGDISTQLAALNRGVRVVTITVGANDLGLDVIAGACATAPDSAGCGAAIAQALTAHADLGQRLAAAYAAVAAAAPKATILVTGYAPLLSSGQVHDATVLLNGIIRGAVAAVAATGVDIHYVDVQFAGHTLEYGPSSWFYLGGPDAFHPTPAGEAAYAGRIEAALF